MRQQKQAFRHNPSEGVYGDCFRTAVACVLELPRDEVPHVFHDGIDGPAADKRMQEWLRRRGLTQFTVCWDGKLSLTEVLHSVNNCNFGYRVEYILTGTSKNGTNHCVVCKGDAIIWDPALDDSGIVGPCDDGNWWVTALAVCRPGNAEKAVAA